jgi:hypothetical protein
LITVRAVSVSRNNKRALVILAQKGATMSTAERSTVVGVFPTHAEAEQAVQDLLAAGFTKEQVGFIGPHPAGHESAPHPEEASGLRAIVGGYTGTAAGGILGGILGAILTVVIPGLGHAVAAGVVGMMLAGAYVGGIAGVLIGMGIPEHEAHAYHREVQAGRTLVTVQVDGRYSEALAILADAGARDATRQAEKPDAHLSVRP